MCPGDVGTLPHAPTFAVEFRHDVGEDLDCRTENWESRGRYSISDNSDGEKSKDLSLKCSRLAFLAAFSESLGKATMAGV